MEHHSDIVPWQMLAQETNIELRYVLVQKDLTLDMDLFEAAIDGKKLVCVVHISNVLGVCNPVTDIVRIAKENGARATRCCSKFCTKILTSLNLDLIWRRSLLTKCAAQQVLAHYCG